jgi:ATP-dependent DNA helicase RecG
MSNGDTINTISFSIEEKQKILYAEEGHFIDLKSKKISPAKLTETLSAFANTAGGELYIGIDEHKRGQKKIRKWNGFSDQEASNGYLQAFEQIFPLSLDFSYIFLTCEGSNGLILKADIQKVTDIKRASNGIAYIRRGAQNLPVDTPQKLRRLEYNKGIISFETELVNVDTRLIERSQILKKFLEQYVPSSSPEAFLHKQQLIASNKATVAAVLLFSDEPQAILPKHCSIKILRYRTRESYGDRETLSPEIITVEGSIYNIIKETVSKVVNIVESIPMLSQGRFILMKYPHETLHEIITNAVLHRDYSIATDIQVRIFDNRIEIESPGRLPGHITEKNILREQYARNGKIVRQISRFPDPPNRDIGEGLNTAFQAMRKLKLRLPEIKEGENNVTVYIYHEPLASPEETVLEYLSSRVSISNSEARIITGIKSENSMKKVFNRLRQQGLIELVPGRRGVKSAWQKVKMPEKPEITKQLEFNFHQKSNS